MATSRPTDPQLAVPREVDDPPAQRPVDPHVAAQQAAVAAIGKLEAAVSEVAGLDLDALPEDGLRELLRGIQRQLDRITAMRASASAALQSRFARRDRRHGGAHAGRDTQQFLVNELNLAPSEAKRTQRTGRQLEASPKTRRAFADGRLGQAHAQVIVDTLKDLHGDERDRIERRLVEAAGTHNPVELGQLTRRLLAETDYQREVRNEQVRHGHRSVRIAQTADGFVLLNAKLAGVAGERAVTAMKAYEQPDIAGQPRRSPEQRAADALDQIFDIALRAGEAPRQHGVRPQVAAVIEWSDLALKAGIAELKFTGPATLAEVRHLLIDSSLTRVVLDARSVPIEVSAWKRSISSGLWTAVSLRDRGCRWPGCHAPIGWCDVAHAIDPFTAGVPLTLDNALLLCRRHHRIFDTGGWTAHIDGPDVTIIKHDHPNQANAPP